MDETSQSRSDFTEWEVLTLRRLLNLSPFARRWSSVPKKKTKKQYRQNKPIKATRRGHKVRVKKLFPKGKARDTWWGVETLAGLPNNNSASSNSGPKDCVNMAEGLNQSCCRFDQSDYSQEREEPIAELTSMTPTQANLELWQVEAELMLKRIKLNKSLRPDQIRWPDGCLLKPCCSRLVNDLRGLLNRAPKGQSTLW